MHYPNVLIIFICLTFYCFILYVSWAEARKAPKRFKDKFGISLPKNAAEKAAGSDVVWQKLQKIGGALERTYHDLERSISHSPGKVSGLQTKWSNLSGSFIIACRLGEAAEYVDEVYAAREKWSRFCDDCVF